MNSLNGIAFNILKSKSHSEDAIQRSFLKIWNSIHQFDEKKSTLFAWMAQITRNTSIDIKRLKSFENEQKSEVLEPNVHNAGSSFINTDKIDVLKIIEQEIREVDRLSRQYKNKNPSLLFRKSELYLEKGRILKEVENEKYLNLPAQTRRRTKKIKYFKQSYSYFLRAKNTV